MRVQQISNTRDTITVQTVEPCPETHVLRIIGECSGVYAVEYEVRGRTVCGQFIDIPDAQELYLEAEDAEFDGDDEAFVCVPNGDGFRWAVWRESVEHIGGGYYEAADGTVMFGG